MRMQRSVCTACGFAGGPRKQVPGSFAIEIVLWCFFAVPGLIYSLWRLTSAHGVCPYCERDAMVPYPSPRARDALKEGAWSAVAEDNYLDAAKRDWRGLVLWTAFSWFWVAVWCAIHSPPLFPAASGIVATGLSVATVLRFPKRATQSIGEVS